MKKIILPMILTMMLLAVAVSAVPSFPMVISGHVNNLGVLYGYKVTLTNVNTGESLTQITNVDGHFLFDANNIGGLRTGDVFEVEVLGHKITIDDFNYDTYAPYYVKFDLHDIECPKCEVCEDCPEPKPCPDCPEPDPCLEPDPCPDCPKCEECPEPCDDEQKALDLLLAVLASAAVTGSAVSLTLSSKAKHYHRGIRNKHSIFTRHRDSLIRHPMGEIAPVYQKKGDRYVYIPKEDR